MKKIKYIFKIKIKKEKGVLYGILLIIPFGIPIILCIELYNKINNSFKKDLIKT